jgi:integrase/recombinase XerD
MCAEGAHLQRRRMSSITPGKLLDGKVRDRRLDPTRGAELPKVGRRLPRGVLSPNEMRRLMRQPDLDTCSGLRDRAILETLYSTGVRNAELRRLTLADIDLERGYIVVINGKNKKDRVVPIGKVAVHFIREYLTKARPKLVRDNKEQTVFLATLRCSCGAHCRGA